MTLPRLLVVDDDPASCAAVAEALETGGYEAILAHDAAEAMALAGAQSFDVILSDIRMPGMDGLQLLGELRRICPDTSVILMTAFGTVDAALEAIKKGAYDYVSKPLRLQELLLTIQRALERRRLLHEVEVSREVLRDRHRIGSIVGVSASMIEIFKLIARVAPSLTPVLITGNSGTGKEVVARTLHFNGPRSAAPFVAINCAGLAEGVLDSELFGHVRGAYTGAHANRQGLFEAGDGGTVFLDEIGDIGPSIQAKLLRVLGEHEIRPVGDNRSRQVDVRIIAATNKDLVAEIREGRFREDLFYRLNVVHIHLPPLRSRREDIPVLAHHFLRKYAEANGKDTERFSAEAMARLESYDWPGNVRELENAVERAVTVGRHPIVLPEDLPLHLAPLPPVTPQAGDSSAALLSLNEVTRNHLVRVLEATGGNKKRAAEILGVDRRTLYRMLSRYEMGTSAPGPGP